MKILLPEGLGSVKDTFIPQVCISKGEDQALRDFCRLDLRGGEIRFHALYHEYTHTRLLHLKFYGGCRWWLDEGDRGRVLRKIRSLERKRKQKSGTIDNTHLYILGIKNKLLPIEVLAECGAFVRRTTTKRRTGPSVFVLCGSRGRWCIT